MVSSVGTASPGGPTRFRFNCVLIFTSHVVMYLIRTQGPEEMWGMVLQLHPEVTPAGSRGPLLGRATAYLPRGSTGSWCGRETRVCTSLLTQRAQAFPHPTQRLLLDSEGQVGGCARGGVPLHTGPERTVTPSSCREPGAADGPPLSTVTCNHFQLQVFSLEVKF